MNRLVLSGTAAVKVAVVLSTVLVLCIIWASSHGPTRSSSVDIHPCALVLNRSGQQECR
jgi:hypothetical protein